MGPAIIFMPWERMLDYCLPPPVSSNTDSSSAFDFLLGKYRECKDTHIGCRSQRPKGAFPPVRVIDVGASMDSHVRLRNTQGLTDELYTCLSYCWGKSQTILLTKQTEKMLYNGISLSKLPKTFYDAVRVTRILGIRYLWIDSLCIFQDREADWSHEASRMCLIYSQAVCTIAATSARDSAGGLFFDRAPEALQPLCVEFVDTPDSRYLHNHPLPGLYWCDIKDAWASNIEQAPLARRAWVCQERHLSPRLIHFTKCGLFWECHEYKATENYPNGIPKWASPSWFEDLTILKRKLYQRETQFVMSAPESTNGGKTSLTTDIDAASDREMYSAWYQFRIAYSSCDLTKEADKLVAIQGIAEHMGVVLGDRLIAGLWHNHLLEDLCWCRFNQDAAHREVTKWRAPTWSWASINGKIWVNSTSVDHMHCPDRQLLSEIDGVDVKSKPSGELEHAILKIRCRPISAVLTPKDDSNRSLQLYGTLTFTNSMIRMYNPRNTIPDLELFRDGPPWEEPRSVFMVILKECRHEADFSGLDAKTLNQSDELDTNYRAGALEGLLLQRGYRDVFKRVGVFMVKGESNIVKVLTEHERAEEAIITLA